MQADPVGYMDSVNLYQYAKNSPLNYLDPFGLMVHDERATRGIINKAVEEVGSGPIDYFTKPRELFGGGKDYDFTMGKMKDDTFMVNGLPMNAGEFGNYVVGYACSYKYGMAGYAGGRLAGEAFGVENIRRDKAMGKQVSWFVNFNIPEQRMFDDAASVEMLTRGAADSYYDRFMNGLKGVANTIWVISKKATEYFDKGKCRKK